MLRVHEDPCYVSSVNINETIQPACTIATDASVQGYSTRFQNLHRIKLITQSNSDSIDFRLIINCQNQLSPFSFLNLWFRIQRVKTEAVLFVHPSVSH